MRHNKTITERFFEKVSRADDPDGCWEWTANKPMGYGHFKMLPGYTIKAHRFSYLFHIGGIPNGMMILHSCDNPGCVNPRHLRPGTNRDNMDDMMMRDRQPGGHGPSGEKCGMSKLNNLKVMQIRDLRATGSSYRELQERFGVSKGCIAAIVKRWTWRHI